MASSRPITHADLAPSGRTLGANTASGAEGVGQHSTARGARHAAHGGDAPHTSRASARHLSAASSPGAGERRVALQVLEKGISLTTRERSLAAKERAVPTTSKP